MEAYVLKDITKFKSNQIQKTNDIVAVEKKIKVYVNNEEVVSLSASPSQIKELVVGFLMTEGILKGDWCPEKINIEENEKDIIVKVGLEGFVSL